MGYKQEALKGIGWIGILRIITRSSTLLKTAILARILTPADFGQFGIVAISLSFFETITETGINQVLIHSDRQTHEILDSAWVVAIVRGFMIALLILLSAYPLSVFFGDRAVLPLILLASLVPAIKGFINPMIVEFYKNLKFDQEFKFRSILLVVDLTTSIGIALITRSALAFIVALIAGGLAEVLLSFFWCRVWPKFRYVKTYLWEIFSFGKWVTLAGIGYWVSSELDDFVAGRLFGTSVLGIYQGAYKVSTLPVTEVSATVNQVAFPILSRMKTEKERFIKFFFSSFLSTNMIGITMALVIFFFPDFVVAVTLGPQWTEAVPILRLLACFGILRTIESSLQPLFLSTGQPRVASFGNLIKVIVLAIGLLLWSRQGLGGISLAVVISAIAVMPYYAWNLLLTLRR